MCHLHRHCTPFGVQCQAHLMSRFLTSLDILLRAPLAWAPVRRLRVRPSAPVVLAARWYRRAPPPPPPLGRPLPPCPCAPAGGALLACSVLRSWGRGLVAPPPALRGGRWSRSRPRAPAATARRGGADQLRDILLHTRGYSPGARATRVAAPPLHRCCTAWCRSSPTMPA